MKDKNGIVLPMFIFSDLQLNRGQEDYVFHTQSHHVSDF